MNKRIFFFVLVFALINVSGIDLWIQPDKFIYKRTEPINIKFLKGDLFNGENWTWDRDKISCLQLYYDDVVDKNLDANFGPDKGDSLQLAMIDEGTVIVTLNTKNSFSDHDSEEFDQYLQANDLAEVPEYRKKNGDTVRNGHENYQYSGKTIFQVGDLYTDVYNKKTDLPLDIIPLSHPYNLPEDGILKIRVYFMGEKLKHAKIKLLHKLDDKVTEQDYTTDDDGEVKFFLTADGEWMVSCVKMISVKNDAQAEWQSYRGTLTWGYY